MKRVLPFCPRTMLAGAMFLPMLVVSPSGQAAEFDCVIEPSQTIEIRSSAEGWIERLAVNRGDVVREGQVVAALDSGLEVANADLAKYKATMMGAIQSGESRVEYARIKARRSEELHRERFVSAQDRDEAETERRLAEAQLVEVRDNQRVAELEHVRENERLRLRSIRSPVNGIVVERPMNVGEFSDNRDTRRPIMKIADIYLLHVESLLPLEAWGKVRVGMNAIVIPEQPIGGNHRARVKVVDRVLDAASGTFGIRLELPNPTLEIPAGVKCRVVFREFSLDRPLDRGQRPAPSNRPASGAAGLR